MNNARRALVVLAICTVLGVAANYMFLSARIFHRADVLLHQAQRIKVGTRPGPELLTMLDTNRDILVQSENCSERDCSYQLRLTNSQIAKYRLVPQAEFSVAVEIRTGMVELLGVGMYRGTGESRIGARTNELAESGEGQECNTSAKYDENKKPIFLLVSLFPRCNKPQQSMALGFEPRCLVAVFGCTSPYHLLSTTENPS